MEKIVFECELVTPMFMYGEDGKTPELRPSSIKGIMRFWWRAINGNLSLDELRKREANIFGSIEKKSSFSIKVTNKNINSNIIQSNPLPHKKFEKEALKENYDFSIIFFINKNKDLIISIFKLSILLGGFGQRSRRGFGSIKIKNQELFNESKIMELVKSINQNFNFYNRKNIEEKYPFIRDIQIGKTYPSSHELLLTIANATHKHNDSELGFAIGNLRLASPVYVSIIKENSNSYKPVITTLETYSSKKINFKDIKRIQDDFKKDIL